MKERRGTQTNKLEFEKRLGYVFENVRFSCQTITFLVFKRSLKICLNELVLVGQIV